MKKVSSPQVVTTSEASELPLPAEIQEALGELVGAAREGLLALSVGLGLSVVHQLMEREVDEVVGPKHKHNPDRTAKRHGHEDGSMTLRPAARARPAADPRSDPRCVGAQRPSPRARAARAARLRPRPHLARRRRLVARGDGRHADADAARDRRPALKDAVLDEPVRVDDRDRPLHAAQREVLAER